MVLSSIINFDAAQKSNDVLGTAAAVPATEGQRNYAVSVALISLILAGAVARVLEAVVTDVGPRLAREVAERRGGLDAVPVVVEPLDGVSRPAGNSVSGS